MKALKFAIIFMGVLIIAGIGLLIYGLTTKVGGTKSRPTAAANFGVSQAQLPVGGRVVETDMDSGRLAVRIELPNGAQSLMLFDTATGAHVGTIDLKAAP